MPAPLLLFLSSTLSTVGMIYHEQADEARADGAGAGARPVEEADPIADFFARVGRLCGCCRSTVAEMVKEALVILKGALTSSPNSQKVRQLAGLLQGMDRRRTQLMAGDENKYIMLVGSEANSA